MGTESTPPATGRAQAAQESRELFLTIGRDLVAELLESPIRNVRSRAVVERTAFTTGAFYNHWPTQDVFQDDLRHFLSSEKERSENVRAVVQAATDGVDESQLSLHDAFQSEISQLVDDNLWWLELAMIASPESEDHRAVGSDYEAWLVALTDAYAEILEQLGLNLATGRSLESVARVLMSLLEGFALQVRAAGSFTPEIRRAAVDALDAVISWNVEGA